MDPIEKARFDALHQRHLRALKLRGLSDSTMDVDARAVRRLAEYDDSSPDQLTKVNLEHLL